MQGRGVSGYADVFGCFHCLKQKLHNTIRTVKLQWVPLTSETMNMKLLVAIELLKKCCKRFSGRNLLVITGFLIQLFTTGIILYSLKLTYKPVLL